MKVVFIAVPTKGTVTDGRLNDSFLKDVEGYRKRFNEHNDLG